MVNELVGMGYYPNVFKKVYLDLKNYARPPARPSIEETHVLELKAVPSHLMYFF